MGNKIFISALVGAVFFILIAPACCGFAAAGKPESKITYNLYFGDLHTHTTYSDAWEGTPWDAYSAAKSAGADFMATTDHAHMLSAAEWTQTLSDAAYWTSSNFVAIPGYEYWLLQHHGEINTFGINYLPPNPVSFGSKQVRLQNFYDWLSMQDGAVGQWNHPTYMTNNYVDYSYRTAQRDVGMGILEVHNYGNWVWKGILHEESSYIMALDQGWHVMPAANSDTHSPDWISGYESRTVLLAESLTLGNLYEAMSACRGYATVDKNLGISYTLNGAVMGSTLSPSSSYTAKIHIEDPDGVSSDAVTLVEIISDNGKVVASLPAYDTTVDWEVVLSSAGATYYYVRVTTASDISGTEGVTAWTAPVWIGF